MINCFFQLNIYLFLLGWFRIESTRNLKPGDVKYIKLNGRHIALFRGEDKIAYAVNAFCTHMGSNLGIGGQVKWKSCIECPFHGWTFNVNKKKKSFKKLNNFIKTENLNILLV